MSNNTKNEIKIPSRISVCFDRKTDKFVISKTDEEDLFHVEKNRKVIKGKHTAREIISIIEKSFGYVPPPKPDLQEKDCVRVKYETFEHDYHRTFVTADPILDHTGTWKVPVFIPLVGMKYVNCEDVKLLRRMRNT